MRAPSSFHSTAAGPSFASAAPTSARGRGEHRLQRPADLEPERARAPARRRPAPSSATAPRSPRSISARRTLGRRARPAACATASAITPASAPWRSSPTSSARRNACSRSVARAEQLGQRRAPAPPASRRPLSAPMRANAASTSASSSDGSAAGRRQLLQRRPADADLPLPQLAGQERDRDRGLLRRGEPQRVGERGDLAAARARGADGLGGSGDVVEEHDARVRGMTALPPGPTEPPVVQTARWLLRPIAFLESCRRRYGDAFSVTFLGFQTPLVMVSDPEAIRALYTERGHTACRRAARSRCSRSWARARCCCSRAREHLARRKLMLPPFHGERMRAYEAIVREVAAARDRDAGRAGEPFALHPRMQAITLEVILRAVFGVTDRERRARLRDLLRELLRAARRRPGSSSACCCRAASAARTRSRELAGAARARSTRCCSPRSPSAARRRRRARGHLLAARRARASRTATAMDDREIRDQLMTLLLAGHETTATGARVDVRPARCATRTCSRGSTARSTRRRPYLRAVIAESLRLRPVVPLAGRRLARSCASTASRCPPGTDVTPAIWLTHTRADRYPEPYAFRPERFLDDAPDDLRLDPVRRRRAPLPRRGVRRDGDARRARRRSCAAATCAPPAAAPSSVARRNVTFSPAPARW